MTAGYSARFKSDECPEEQAVRAFLSERIKGREQLLRGEGFVPSIHYEHDQQPAVEPKVRRVQPMLTTLEFLEEIQYRLVHATQPPGSDDGKDLADNFTPIKTHLLRMLLADSDGIVEKPKPIGRHALEALANKMSGFTAADERAPRNMDYKQARERMGALNRRFETMPRYEPDPPSSMHVICQLPVRLAQARLILQANGIPDDNYLIQGIDQLQAAFKDKVIGKIRSQSHEEVPSRP